MYSRIIRAGLISCAIVFGLAASAEAQQSVAPEKRALIVELMDVFEMRKTTEAIMSAMFSQVEQMTSDAVSQAVSKREDLTPKQREELRRKMNERNARIAKRYRELFPQRIDLGQIVEDISLVLYDKYFTENELKDLIAFYKSPTGKKSIAAIPRLLADSMSKTNELLVPRARKLMEEVIAEDEKRAGSTQPASPPDQKR